MNYYKDANLLSFLKSQSFERILTNKMGQTKQVKCLVGNIFPFCTVLSIDVDSNFPSL